MSNQPLDKGRVTFVAETYQGQQGEKKRYATLGRATKWAGQNGGPENITLELDSMPIGRIGPISLFIFWDSEQQQDNQQQGQQQQGYQQPQQGYQQPQQGYRR